jgi:uncharacterized protein with PIN domain
MRSKKQIENSIYVIENNLQHTMHEATARRHAKNYLIHINGNKCSICNTETWMDYPVPLVCDHINGDTADNSIKNYRLVCCNCDAQLPTFKSKNRGSGRAYDRKYMNTRNNGSVAEHGLRHLT